MRNEIILEFLNELTDREIVCLIFHNLGLSQREIAKIRGYTRGKVYLSSEKIQKIERHLDLIATLQEIAIGWKPDKQDNRVII